MTDENNYETQAKEMGWVPQDQWKGDPDKWTDAQEYVERGEQILPIVRANNRRLQDELLTYKSQNDNLHQQLEATRKIVQGLEGKFNESLQRQLKEQRAELRANLKDAVEDRDIDREMDIRDQLDQLSRAEKDAKETPKAKQDPPNPNPQVDIDPDFNKWKAENTWFDGKTAEDRKKTKAVVRAAEDLRDEGDTSQGYDFYNKALARVEEQLGERPASKVDSGNSRSSAQPGNKSFGSLPKEAQDACMADIESFVGEDKLFKSVDEWKKYYTDTYYGS